MVESMIRRLKNLLRPPKHHKLSWSQCGEDLIVAFLLKDWLHVQQPTYLDIGAHNATYLSNTYHFYRQGCSGVCVEPDPDLAAAIAARRPRDVVVNAGIGESDETGMDFYVMDSRFMNTFSKSQCDELIAGGAKLQKTIRVPLININRLMDERLKRTPDFVSLDTEGFDLPILRSWDLKRHRPKVFCVETLTQDKEPQKITEISTFLVDNGYRVHADTFINTIYVDQLAWAKRDR